MPTNLDGGFTLGGAPVIPGGGDLPLTTGNYFWVSSVTGSNGFPGSADQPFATLDFAIGRCTANKGDTIVLLQGHAETLTAADGVLADVAGVNIVGLGVGADRPEFTFGTATSASFRVTAANVSVSNIVGIAGIDGLTNPFHIQAANCSLDIEWQDGSSLVEAARAVLTTAAADNLTCKLKYIGFPAGNACVNAIRLVGCNNGDLTVDLYGLASTAWVEFLTTACTNINVTGYMYNSGTTNFSKSVVDTATSSTWFASFYDGAAASLVTGGSGAALAADDVATVAAGQNVATADAATNTLSRDVIGNKTDAAVTAVDTTKSIVAYVKGAISWLTVATADASTNAAAKDVIGNKTDASIYVPGTTNSLAAYAKGTANLQERVAIKSAAVMTNGLTLFTVAGGPIQVMALVSICATTNDATASTLQYSATPTSGSATTISGASASLTVAAAGASVTLAGTALSTAALLSATGPNLIANPGTVIVPAGVITAVVAVGSTTGTWAHYIRYKPLAVGVTVS